MPPALVGRTPLARPHHLFPAVFRRVCHAAAKPEDGEALIHEPLANIAPDGQPLEPPPFTGLQKRIAQFQCAGTFQFDRNAPGWIPR
ncbi:MAG: hypothetical protein WCR20_13315, partial [Verrucomicrobiota bacterium]